MTVIGYPTNDFPALLPFTIDLPPGWQGVHLPGAVLAGRGPEPGYPGGLRPNVVVTWQRVVGDPDVASIARHIIQAAQRRDPTLRFDALEVATTESFDAALALGRSSSPMRQSSTSDGDPAPGVYGVRRAVLFIMGPRITSSRGLYQATGTCTAPDDQELIRRCLLSFTLATPRMPVDEPVPDRASL